MFRNRRRPRYGAPVCATISAVLLLLSVTILYIRLNSTSTTTPNYDQYESVSLTPLLRDTTDLDYHSSDDPIDQLDDTDPNLLTTTTAANADYDDDDDSSDQIQNPKPSSFYFYDHLSGVIRRGYNRRSIEEWEDDVSFDTKLKLELGFDNEMGNIAFGTDDVPVEERIRKSLVEVVKIEDAFLLKGSMLREGWGEWFDKKTDFLRRDRMFKSNLEGLNPGNNPMLQDPDAPGVTGLSRGDKIIMKGIINQFKSVPVLDAKSEMKRARRRTSDDSRNMGNQVEANGSKSRENSKVIGGRNLKDEFSGQGHANGKTLDVRMKSNNNEVDVNGSELRDNLEVIGGGNLKEEVHADGKRWGYYPGIDGRLSFSKFMDAFFSKGNCSIRVFMVWNSPSWVYGVRHQRGLESVLFHHPDACVVVFSETIELNFFPDFVKEGFKVAVVMPNLDELLKDTPTHIFASVWYEWKQTKYYPLHYSELIRLAALYKYGGVYLDSDIIVLNPISSLLNIIGMEDEQDGSTLNGAVMASDKHSHFIMECLKEFYASYDDTILRWNGADLLSRVAGNLSSSRNHANKVPQSVSFPINRKEIPRYFAAPKTEIEKSEEDNFVKKISKEYATFHLWNSITSALIPEPNSVVARILNKQCIHCSDIL